MPRFRVNVNGWVYEGNHRLATDATLAAMRKWMQGPRLLPDAVNTPDPADGRPMNPHQFDEIAVLCERIWVRARPDEETAAETRAAGRNGYARARSVKQPTKKTRSRLESPPLDT